MSYIYKVGHVLLSDKWKHFRSLPRLLGTNQIWTEKYRNRRIELKRLTRYFLKDETPVGDKKWQNSVTQAENLSRKLF